MTGSDTTELKETNIGMMMLVKIGWRSGTGLGSNGQGKSSLSFLSRLHPGIKHWTRRATCDRST
jgi:hypothetical protein